MHRPVDPNWLLQSIVLVLTLALGFLYLVRDTALRYFTQLDSDDKSMRTTEAAAGAPSGRDSCAVCRLPTTKHCSRCKMVKYCSEACQRSHWNSEHKKKCKNIRANQKNSASALGEKKASLSPPAIGSSKSDKKFNKILFPYEEFVKLFDLETPGFPPCGLLNCGNSCFANVVLQCLTYTHPLVAYLLNMGHKRECRRNAWCFLCEFETHVERSTRNSTPFSPISILSRLPNIGGNLGYGQQEDAHEFMRFAIDTMQSACLDEFGGEKSVHPIFQETTLVQHIFGGRLQSQVMCTECNNISNQFESMMDLTVEINGDAGSLEECLDQFTVKEWLHGDNMYKCDSCNAYVMAWKRLTIHRPPNVLTIALKRFQSGRFGKLNKKVTFPETFDLSPYMGDKEDSQNTYKLYTVIVHMDMLNASFFGHYICYVKDFSGNWYRVDDCEVVQVDVDEVLSQGAYMLMYKRICARPSSLLPSESLTNQVNEQTKIEVDNSLKQPADCSSSAICANGLIYHQNPSSSILSAAVANHGNTPLSASNPECTIDDAKAVSSEAVLPIITENECRDGEIMSSVPKEVSYSLIDEFSTESNGQKSEISLPASDGENASRRNSDPTDDSARITDHESSGVARSCTLDEAINKSSHHMDEDPCEVKSSNSVSEIGNSGNGSMPAHCSKEVIGKSNGKTLGSKPKPLFASGFLDRKSLKDPNKLDNNRTKAYEKLPENGQILEDEHIEAVEVDKRKDMDDKRVPSNTTQ